MADIYDFPNVSGLPEDEINLLVLLIAQYGDFHSLTAGAYEQRVKKPIAVKTIKTIQSLYATKIAEKMLEMLNKGTHISLATPELRQIAISKIFTYAARQTNVSKIIRINKDETQVEYGPLLDTMLNCVKEAHKEEMDVKATPPEEGRDYSEGEESEDSDEDGLGFGNA